MNPNAPQQNFELPTPQPVSTPESGSQPQEQSPARPETYMQPQAPQAGSTPAAMPAPTAIPQADPVHMPASQQPVSTTNPAVADDTDLIEKEWVTKAKQIVASTRDDPHLQNKEINKFKADYLKKRYNKDIKLEDS